MGRDGLFFSFRPCPKLFEMEIGKVKKRREKKGKEMMKKQEMSFNELPDDSQRNGQVFRLRWCRLMRGCPLPLLCRRPGALLPTHAARTFGRAVLSEFQIDTSKTRRKIFLFCFFIQRCLFFSSSSSPAIERTCFNRRPIKQCRDSHGNKSTCEYINLFFFFLSLLVPFFLLVTFTI